METIRWVSSSSYYNYPAFNLRGSFEASSKVLESVRKKEIRPMHAHPTQRHTTTLSPKEALRAHVDQLSPAQQRAFVAAALALLAARNMLDEVEETIYRIQPLPASMHTAVH
jgi:hypothetical protein